MVKAKKQGRAGRKATFLSSADQEKTTSNEVASDGPRPSLRLQKKVNRKVGFLSRVANSAAASGGGVKKKKTPAKKRVSRALGDFSSLGDALKEMQDTQQKANSNPEKASKPGVKSSAARKHIIKEENTRLQGVITHPEYKANPLSAIASHLQATLPSVPEKILASKAKGRTQGKRAKRKKGVTTMES